MTICRLGYLGPRGTFSEDAALIYNSRSERMLREHPTIASVITALMGGELEEGLVPLENNLEGGIAATLDLLAKQDGIYICYELVCPVSQCLMAEKKMEAGEIKQILSHPHALGQCTDYISRYCPEAECLPVESTASAAKSVLGRPGTAAVANRRAAELFGLTLLAEGIQDNEENTTRFVVLSRSDHPPTGNDKTSLVLSVPDGPGTLYQTLGYFARQNINLTRIESRPSRRIIGDWLFFIDCEGHRSDPGLVELWEELKQAVPFLKLLGSYPKSSLPAHIPGRPDN